MSLAFAHIGLLDIIVCSVEMLREGELCCLGHREKASCLCLFYKIFHREDHPMNEYLQHFLVACSTRVSAALCEMTLGILHL